MAARHIPLDIWDRILHHCTPWTRYSASFVSKEIFDHCQPVKYQSEPYYFKNYKRFCKNTNMLKEMDDGGRKPIGYVFGDGLTFRKIQGYTCVFTCDNADGEDTRLLDWLILIDDYWRQRLPPCLTYQSFLLENGHIRGHFSPVSYKPTFDVEGDLCQTKAEKNAADCGLLHCLTSGDNSMDLARRGYEAIRLLLRPCVEGLDFSIQIFVDSADPWCS